MEYEKETGRSKVRAVRASVRKQCELVQDPLQGIAFI